MPTYEYRRPDGTTFEIVQKMSDDALTTDPDSGVPVERVFHPVAIHFKGKGFHNTDYGTKRRNRELEASAESGADAHDAKMADKRATADAAKPETKPDAKPDSKPDAKPKTKSDEKKAKPKGSSSSSGD